MLKLKVDKLLGRRKLKKDYEYEVQWQGKGPEAATWLTRDDLVEMGLEKMVQDLDMKEAARAVSHWLVFWGAGHLLTDQDCCIRVSADTASSQDATGISQGVSDQRIIQFCSQQPVNCSGVC